MGATEVTKVLKCVDNTNTTRTIKLYDNKSNFTDYDGGKYFAIYDGTATRYAYCSSKLWTNEAGDTTSCLIAKFIDDNGDLRYMYTEQPSESEELYQIFTSSVSSETLISKDDNECGCYIYVVNTKGKNGNAGSTGASGYVTSSGSGAYLSYTGHSGAGGSGGSGGAGGTTVTTALTIDEKTLNMSLAGMCGAGGGGGGGGGNAYASGQGGNATYTIYPGGAGGAGGSANNVSKTYRIRVSNALDVIGNITVKANDSTYAGKTGSAGQKHNEDPDGGDGGASGDGNAGSGGGDGDMYQGGTGGKGGNAGDSRTASVSGTAISAGIARNGQQFNSSTNTFSSSISSNGGVVITKIIASYET